MAAPVAQTWTVTFSECVENHVGMEQLGTPVDSGYTIEDLYRFKRSIGGNFELIDLEAYLPVALRSNETPAMLLILRQGARRLVGEEHYEALLADVKSSVAQVDKKAWMRGRVVNKLARHNLCYGETAQEPNYEAKKGCIVAFSEVPALERMRARLGEVFGSKAESLLAELNYYYDQSKCGIGFHGDSERSRVIGLRVGAAMNFHFQWYHEGEAVGARVDLMLDEGDLYIPCQKSVGKDWKRRKIPTLRHAAGAAKYTNGK